MVINVKAIKQGSCKRAAAVGWRLLIGGVICGATGIWALSGWVIRGCAVRLFGRRETERNVLSLQRKKNEIGQTWLVLREERKGERGERKWQDDNKRESTKTERKWQHERTASNRIGQKKGVKWEQVVQLQAIPGGTHVGKRKVRRLPNDSRGETMPCLFLFLPLHKWLRVALECSAAIHF